MESKNDKKSATGYYSIPVNKTIKYVFLGVAIFFQLYLAYASTLYLEPGSGAFWLVVFTALLSVAVICYFICVVFERQNKDDNVRFKTHSPK